MMGIPVRRRLVAGLEPEQVEGSQELHFRAEITRQRLHGKTSGKVHATEIEPKRAQIVRAGGVQSDRVFRIQVDNC